MQCEGNLWTDALNTWLTDEKTALKKQREEANRRKEAAPALKKKKKIDTEPDPALNDDLEEKLKMGLDILIRLAHIIHEAVCNTPFLATEPGCKDFSEQLKLKNTSLLVSVPSKLEPYPGRNSSHSWMGKSAVRFWEAQRGTVPAKGAAPAAQGGAAPAAEGGVAPAAEGADGGAAVGADGGAAAADSGRPQRGPPRFGKVRSLLLTPTGIENSTVTAVLMTFFQPRGVVIADTREGAGWP